METDQLKNELYDVEHPDSPKNLINRELGLLAFQRRVLDEAKDKTNPLIERIRFLSILGSNMDEFFMVRVGGLYVQNVEGVKDLSMDGRTPAEQLAEIRKEALQIMKESRAYFNDKLKPELNEDGIHVLGYDELEEKQKQAVDTYFHNVVFPVLTPLAFDPGHPFPHISNLSLNLAVVLEDQNGNQRFARVKVPSSLPQMVPLKRSSGSVRRDGTVPYHHYFVWLYEVIMANLGELFPGMIVVEAHPFHITRNADFEIQEVEADDLLLTVEEKVRRRRFGPVVRLMVFDNMPDYILEILMENLGVHKLDVYILDDKPLNLVSLESLTSVDRYDLRYSQYTPRIPTRLRVSNEMDEPPIFTAMQQSNIYLHHPYDSFVPVVEFLQTAARDPNVLAIKQTLYRVGSNSPVVDALLEACRDYGKQVAVLVELKARFDEESNIGWARLLEQEGVHVTYGLMGLKTHTKIAMVIRKEGDTIRRYVHLGTGNYNHITANLYEDIGMFTTDEAIGADATDLFNFLTGYSYKSDYRKLLVAPINLREELEKRIRREIEHKKEHGHGYLIFKSNAIIDPGMISLLYQASQAGVKIILIVRGVCSLRPGIEGLSENIRVVSVLGRYLEHSRIYYFHNGGNEEIFMGSADLMPRNLDRRVETLFPIENKDAINYIRDQILRVYLRDNTKARLMRPDGSYFRVHPRNGAEPFSIQEHFMYHRVIPEIDLEDDDFIGGNEKGSKHKEPVEKEPDTEKKKSK
ncbi:MAG: polyphosphate kinase 1 [Anaerolineaceae bacterium]|nr:polyphosphate kinase 1 [Anaerolineaceae bacterium]